MRERGFRCARYTPVGPRLARPLSGSACALSTARAVAQDCSLSPPIQAAGSFPLFGRLQVLRSTEATEEKGIPIRTLSYSELSTAMTCPARWDFAYGGRLAGTTLKRRAVANILSEGRAWGAAVAQWHAGSDPLTIAGVLYDSLCDDVTAQAARGHYVPPGTLIDLAERLTAILSHHTATVERLDGLELLEEEFNVPITARTTRTGRGSSRYRYHCFIDGHTTYADLPAVVEYKLRNKLTSPVLIQMMPQYRWYAWAYARKRKITGPVTVLIDETLNQVPREPRRLANGKVSNDVRQYITADAYRAACASVGQEPNETAVLAFEARDWHRRTTLTFTPDELGQAGAELTSGAKLIGQLDRGELWPIRNGTVGNCRYCDFEPVCRAPDDLFTIQALYERTEPKRLRTWKGRPR